MRSECFRGVSVADVSKFADLADEIRR